MAPKAITVNGEERPAQIKRQEPSAVSNLSGNVVDTWKNFTSFLTDVRAETRKVVTPSRKEVEATTSVVLIAVFIFGFYFWIIDNIFNRGLQAILHRLGGVQ
jgi:preprotein translocase subunit SecE